MTATLLAGPAAEATPEMRVETQPANRDIVRTYGETIRTRTQEFVQCEVADIRSNRRRGAAEVSIRFTVTPDGQVTEAKSIYADTGTPGLTQCLISNLRAIRFPPPGPNPVFVTYPFRFNRTRVGSTPTRRTVARPVPKKTAKKNVKQKSKKRSAPGVAARRSAGRRASPL